MFNGIKRLQIYGLDLYRIKGAKEAETLLKSMVPLVFFIFNTLLRLVYN
jgi:hypothetical protein